MADIPLELSIINANPTIVRKRNQSSSNNLFNDLQRNHSMSSTAPLPIITLSSFSNFEEKLIRMATNNKSNTSIEFPTVQIKSRIPSSNRFNPLPMMKSSTSITRPPTSQRSNNQQQSPMTSHRALTNNLNRSPRKQQQSAFSHPNSQYGHFLAYLRRQTLARMRRKQQEEEGNTDNTETIITFNSNKYSSILPFQSTSNYSLNSLTTDTQSLSNISLTAKRAGKPLSTYRQLQRSKTNDRFNRFQKSPPKYSTDDQLITLTSSLLITPANSVVDDSAMPPIKPPYELHLNDDKLNYCYISDDSGVKYQGQMLSTSV